MQCPHKKEVRSCLSVLAMTVTLAGSCISTGAEQPDKSGVSPNTISVPTGPGSIEGLGESFQPTLNTGTAKYGIGLVLPPGTAGHAPVLSLRYEGGGGNGILGFGWSLTSAYVQRRSDEGIPTYRQDVGVSRQDTFINEMKEELVPTADGFYFCKNEAAFVRYRQVEDHWEATTPEGTILEYGISAGARVHDGAGRVFCWMLERETDTRGNTITYSYISFPTVENLNQIYLETIRYGPGAPPWANFHFVQMVYENRSDWFEDCRPGFPVRTGKRLRSVIIGTQGPSLPGHASGDFEGDGMPDHLVRQYDLGYLGYAGADSHWSLLATITQVGADGTSTLPPARFDYLVCNPPELLDATHHIIGSLNTPPFVMDNPLVDLVDLDGDGLPDVLKTDLGGGRHTAYLNGGEQIVNGQRVIRWRDGLEMGGASEAQLFNLQSEEGTGTHGSHLADMDGDGVADFVVTAGLDNVFYFANRNEVAWGERRQMSVEDFPPPAPFGTPGVRTADLDFDKRIDIIRSLPDGQGYHIWFNLGDQTYSRRVLVESEVGAGFDLSLATVQIADLNGDRVPDIAWIRPSSVAVTTGLGYGRFASPVEIPLPDGFILSELQLSRTKLIDITGNGLADLVIERAEGSELWYWINLGTYAFSSRKRIIGLPAPIGPNAVIRWADFNGNGTTDYVFADRDSLPTIQTADLGELIIGGTSLNALTEIANGIGGITRIGYTSSTVYRLADADAGQPWPDPVPFPIQVVSSVAHLDSFGGEYVTRFHYHDGYYDPQEKQFRGFARVEQIDVGDSTAPTLVTRSHFDTGRDFEVMKGKLLRLTTEQEDGGEFYDQSIAWSLPPRVLAEGTNGTAVTYAHPVGTTHIMVELGQGAPLRLETEMDFDEFGNQILDANYGIVVNDDRSAFDDERIIVTNYAINTDAWLLRLPKRREIIDVRGVVHARSEFFYDDETFSGDNLGTVTMGNLTMTRKWIDPAIPAAFVISSRTKYDSYGNPNVMLGPLAEAPEGVVNFDRGHVRMLTYESGFHSHPVSESIHVGAGSEPLVFQASYNEGLGVMLTSTDFNSQSTRYGYDTFARISSITRPGDSPEAPTEAYDYRLAIAVSGDRTLNWIETRQRETPGGGTVDSRVFFDGLGRKIMRRAQGETPDQIVVTDTVRFNDRRTEWKTYLPYFDTGNLDFADPTFATPFQERHYDALGRGKLVYQPDTGQGRSFSRTVYEPLARFVQDEEQTRPDSVHYGCGFRYIEDGLRNDDGQGRLRIVEEIVRVDEDGYPTDTLQTWTTTYRYDVLDNFAGYTDSQGNQKHFLYDGLSRRVFMDDPNRGLYWWAYDDAGNVVRTCDAKNQHLVFTYDGANRILAEWHLASGVGGPSPVRDKIWTDPPATPASTPDVAYHYDLPVGPLPKEELWRPREAEGIAKVVLEQGVSGPLADVNQDGIVDARDVALRSASPATGPAIEAGNTLGRLAWVRDQSGEEHLSYDARGRAVWKIKRFGVPGETGLLSFHVENAFDSMDRLTRHAYPDGAHVDYAYNARGLLGSVVGTIDQVNYNPTGQPARIDLANGVGTQLEYDNRLRLHRSASVRQADSIALKHLEYAYDEVSNIAAIADRRSLSDRTAILAEAAPSAAVSPTDIDDSFAFAYDSLYRLTTAAGPGHGVHTYRFDPIGNMLSQGYNGDSRFAPAEQGGMRYGENGQGPQALSRLDRTNGTALSFRYDANGNMESMGDGAALSWDPKDRMIAAEENGVRHTHIYDYAGTRSIHIAESGGQTLSRTLYIDRTSEFRNGRLVKYVHVGEDRVARSDFSGTPGTSLTADQFYLHDHLGSTSVAMDVGGSARQISSYGPYGNNRLRSAVAPSAIDYGFSGKELHESPDLSYFETRYLSSGFARFLQTDTLTLDPLPHWHNQPQAWHPYSYTWGNPVTLVDRDGTDASQPDAGVTLVNSMKEVDPGDLEALRSRVESRLSELHSQESQLTGQIEKLSGELDRARGVATGYEAQEVLRHAPARAIEHAQRGLRRRQSTIHGIGGPVTLRLGREFKASQQAVDAAKGHRELRSMHRAVNEFSDARENVPRVRTQIKAVEGQLNRVRNNIEYLSTIRSAAIEALGDRRLP